MFARFEDFRAGDANVAVDRRRCRLPAPEITSLFADLDRHPGTSSLF
jgi:hypothetical protein